LRREEILNEIEILKKEIEIKGIKQVASELGVSTSSINLLIADKYPGSLKTWKRGSRRYTATRHRMSCSGQNYSYKMRREMESCKKNRHEGREP
jgi:hypothetical protein